MLYVDTSRKFRKNPRFWAKNISTKFRKFRKYFYRGGVTPSDGFNGGHWGGLPPLLNSSRTRKSSFSLDDIDQKPDTSNYGSMATSESRNAQMYKRNNAIKDTNNPENDRSIYDFYHGNKATFENEDNTIHEQKEDTFVTNEPFSNTSFEMYKSNDLIGCINRSDSNRSLFDFYPDSKSNFETKDEALGEKKIDQFRPEGSFSNNAFEIKSESYGNTYENYATPQVINHHDRSPYLLNISQYGQPIKENLMTESQQIKMEPFMVNENKFEFQENKLLESNSCNQTYPFQAENMYDNRQHLVSDLNTYQQIHPDSENSKTEPHDIKSEEFRDGKHLEQDLNLQVYHPIENEYHKDQNMAVSSISNQNDPSISSNSIVGEHEIKSEPAMVEAEEDQKFIEGIPPSEISLEMKVSSRIKENPVVAKTQPCPFCSHISSSQGNLKQHVKGVHQKVRDQVCPHCTYKTTQKGTLKRHIRIIHDGNKMGKKERLSCNNCTFSTKSKNNLAQHVVQHHKNDQNRIVIQNNDFMNSMNSENQTSANYNPAENLTCKTCSYVASDRENFFFHVESSHSYNMHSA